MIRPGEPLVVDRVEADAGHAHRRIIRVPGARRKSSSARRARRRSARSRTGTRRRRRSPSRARADGASPTRTAASSTKKHACWAMCQPKLSSARSNSGGACHPTGPPPGSPSRSRARSGASTAAGAATSSCRRARAAAAAAGPRRARRRRWTRRAAGWTTSMISSCSIMCMVKLRSPASCSGEMSDSASTGQPDRKSAGRTGVDARFDSRAQPTSIDQQCEPERDHEIGTERPAERAVVAAVRHCGRCQSSSASAAKSLIASIRGMTIAAMKGRMIAMREKRRRPSAKRWRATGGRVFRRRRHRRATSRALRAPMSARPTIVPMMTINGLPTRQSWKVEVGPELVREDPAPSVPSASPAQGMKRSRIRSLFTAAAPSRSSGRSGSTAARRSASRCCSRRHRRSARPS